MTRPGTGARVKADWNQVVRCGVSVPSGVSRGFDYARGDVDPAIRLPESMYEATMRRVASSRGFVQARSMHHGPVLLLGLLAACGSAPSPEGASAAGQPRSGLVAVQERAPELTAPDQTGTPRSLSEFRGKAVVLYFYPRDATPGCTEEACAFRDRWDQFAEAGAQVLGVSTDTVESHAAFAREHELPFPLLADPEGEVLEAYGVETRFGLAQRVTFVIDGTGVVRRVFPDVDPAVHADEVLEVLEQLRQVERH